MFGFGKTNRDPLADFRSAEKWLASFPVADPLALHAEVIAELIKLGGTLTDRNMTKDCSWCQFYALCHAELRGQDAKYVKKSQYEYREQEHGDQEEAE